MLVQFDLIRPLLLFVICFGFDFGAFACFDTKKMGNWGTLILENVNNCVYILVCFMFLSGFGFLFLNYVLSLTICSQYDFKGKFQFYNVWK